MGREREPAEKTEKHAGQSGKSDIPETQQRQFERQMLSEKSCEITEREPLDTANKRLSKARQGWGRKPLRLQPAEMQVGLGKRAG